METITTRKQRKTAKGTVVSNKMNKTVVVRIDRKMTHPRYGKVVTRSKRVYAHNEADDLQIGDTVTIMETRPLSKLKRWRVVEKIKSGAITP